MTVLETCKPRFEVLKGDLDDAIFAADFGDLVAGKAPKVYSDATAFFQNTHPARPLLQIVQAIFNRLNDPREGGITVRLSTGFGGGKTHTLMALWHLGQNIGNNSLGTELLPASNRPSRVTVVAIDLGKAGVPIFNQHGSIRVRSLWGEIFFLLDPELGLKALGDADHPEASPNAAQIEEVLPDGPILFLLDEIVIYMAKLTERGQGNLLGFLNLLASVVRNRPQTCLVVTDPGSQAVYAAQSSKMAAQLTTDAAKLEEIFGRKMSDMDPIGDESAKVIVRRLFESVDSAAAETIARLYSDLYNRLRDADPKSVPPEATAPDYEKKIAQSYPFHPRLLETAKDRLAALDHFQQSRGVLRLFARILRDVWDQNVACQMITAGELDWTSPRIQADLLQRLNRDRFKAAVSADIAGHALELDGGMKLGIHGRAAAALLLESLPLTSNSGLDEPELTLAVVRPDEAGPEPAEAMDRLAGVCWHTYPMPGGRGLQFRYDQNILKQIDERRSKISREDAISRVEAEVQGYFQGPIFRLCSWPSAPSQVQESDLLQLALCEDEQIAKAVVTYSDNRDPAAPVPRAFRNAILAVTATSTKWDGAIERVQRLMAAEQIERENKTGQSGAEVRDQLGRILPDLKKQFLLQAYRAFDRVIVGDGTAASMEEQYLADESKVLQKPSGQVALSRFLSDKNLLYQPSDALDANRFVTSILPGATPAQGQSDVFTTTAVHERILSAPGLRLVPGPDVVRNTLLKAVAAGKIVVKTADGSAYDSKGCVTGVSTKRRREKGELRTLPLDDSTLVALTSSAVAKEWLTESTPKPGGGPGGDVPKPPPTPPPPSQVVAQTWEKIIEYSEKRALLELKLVAPNPSLASSLPTLAQPLGADSITVNVTVSGELKDGGSTNFAADEVRLTHPTKPFQIAQTIFNSAREGVSYEAQLAVRFKAPGRTNLTESLKLLVADAAADIRPSALFDKPTS